MTALSSTKLTQPDTAQVIRHRRRPIAPYFLIIPAIAILLVALAYPLGWQFVTSMQKFGLAQQFGKPPEFVGLANYIALFSDAQTWAVVGRSIAFFAFLAAFSSGAKNFSTASLKSAVALEKLSRPVSSSHWTVDTMVWPDLPVMSVPDTRAVPPSMV